ncbi:hypothetical protein [Amycolatopsis sp. cmx-4-61]|uniref:hypothetical protein n=1 Tax=Amycolatopsis sp. cmx-4-61 TaxID=2790937 RepID=UPI00397E4197
MQVDLADRAAVRAIVHQRQIGPAPPDDHPAPLGPDRLDGHLGDVGRGAHAAEPHVHRRITGIEERRDPGRQRAVVRQDPRTGLPGVEVRRLGPRRRHRIRGRPGPVGQDVAADVVDGGQAHRRPVGVERGAEHLVVVAGVQLPPRLVVGRLGRERPSRERHRRMVRRGRMTGQ